MDRFKKYLRDLRLKVRRFIDRNWHNDPEGDVFRSWNVLFVLGAVRYKPIGTWRRICWNTHCIASVCVYLMFVLNLVDEIPGKLDVVKATWKTSIVLTASLLFMKDLILNRHYESIQIAQKYVNSKPSGSGDMLNDSVCRKKFFQRLQSTAFALLVLVLMDQVIFLWPNSGLLDLFGSPRILRRLGSELEGGINFVFLFTIPVVWVNKYCAGTGTICSLMDGFKTEYDIFVRGFETTLDNVYSDVEDKLPSTLKAAPEWKRRQRDQLFWKYLELRINDQVKLHVQLVENMHLLKPVVKALFGMIYYNAMVVFSPFIYVVMSNGPSFTSLCVLSATTINLLECYAWCNIIDSLTDANETLELEIMELIAKIPHSQLHHEKYVEARTTLCIMKTFVRNNEPFSCGGVFPITVEAFTELLNVGYSVLTFLRDIEKKG